MRISIQGLDWATQDVSSIIADTERYSITPPTFHERSFENAINDLWYKDEYRSGENSAIRFGINALSTNVAALIQSESSIINDDSVSTSSIKSAGYKPDEAARVQLLSLEIDLLNKAVKHLLSANTNAVLVDIFARVNGGPSNGSIKIKDGTPETHTVVLYKNPQNDQIAAPAKPELFVIDPSNFLFSSHLSNFNRIDGIEHNFTINTTHRSTQIYKPLGIPGPKPDQYRDCIDIAAKIAFGLNAIEIQPYFRTPDETTKCSVVKNISNVQEIDTSIMKTLSPVRIKQTSDIGIISAFNQAELLIKNLIVFSQRLQIHRYWAH